MSLVNFTNLDFDQIKESIKNYIRSNPEFTDYNFEGSNMSIIIDILAYNTYISAFNANMLSNEVFIDSATLRENVVSLAKNIGYSPRSKVSSKANISFFVDTSNFVLKPVALILKKGIVCTTNSFGSSSYRFCILDDITVPVVNDVASFNDITIYEGTYTTEKFIVDSNIPNQRFILNNPNIDTNTLRVLVRGSETSTTLTKFSLVDTLFNVDKNSKIFFVSEVEDEKYELIFGDNVFGKKLIHGNVIEVSYIVTNGSDANSISSFKYSGRIFDNEDRIITNGISLITTNSSSQGGNDIESIESIKKYAPKIFSSQYRAVTPSDYETIVPLIYPEAESVSAYGGESLTPPRYGKVFISIKPKNGPFVPSQVKNNIKNKLRKYSVSGIVSEILDLAYLYIEIDSKVYYNTNYAVSPESIKSIVIDNIKSYAKENLNSYKTRFKYSKFLKIIDDSNKAITSNITTVRMRRDLRVNINKFTDYLICYGNRIYPNMKGFNIKSSGFNVSGVSDQVYLTDFPEPNGKYGTISYIKLIDNSNYSIVRKNAGRIDYENGEITIYVTNITNTQRLVGSDNIIQISAVPYSNDIIGKTNLYLQLDISNSTIDIIPDTIESGANPSGTTYVVTSSFSNGNIIRK